MKRLYSLLLGAFLLLAFTPDIHAQATLNFTTLSSAITTPSGTTGPSTAVVVASLGSGSTAIAVGNILFVDGEAMQVRVVPTSGTTLTVVRAYNGTIAQTHAANAVIYYGLPTFFPRGTPGLQLFQGTCTSTVLASQPTIDVINGQIWYCRDGRWGGYRLAAPQGNTQVYHPVSNANYTATINDEVIGYTSIGAASGLGASRSVTLPSATGLAGKTIMIRDESGAVGTGLNTIFVIPNLNGGNLVGSITTAYGSITVKSNGTSWFKQ